MKEELLKEISQKLKKEYFINEEEKKSKNNENFILVENFSFEKSEKKVFFGENREENNDSKKELGFFGLKKQQLFFEEKEVSNLDGKLTKIEKPIYLVDNHNNALFAFYEISKILKEIKNNEKINIIHIDAHRDNAFFQHKYPKEINYKNMDIFLEKTRVSDYLDLAQKTNIIGEILNITQSYEFDNFYKNSNIKKKEKDILNTNYILNLDIDIFGEEGEMVENDLKINSIKKAWKNALAVVIATSPGYIKSEKAQKMVEFFISERN